MKKACPYCEESIIQFGVVLDSGDVGEYCPHCLISWSRGKTRIWRYQPNTVFILPEGILLIVKETEV